MASTSRTWAAVILVLPKGSIYHSKFHNWFRLSSNTKVILLTISEAAVLVWLMKGIYEVCHWDGLRWLIYTYHVSKQSVQANCSAGITVGIYEACCWDGLRWHDIHTKFLKDQYRCPSIVAEVYTYRHRHTYIYTQQGDFSSPL